MDDYDVVDGLGVLGEDVIEDFIEVVLFGRQIFVISLHILYKLLGDDLTLPGGEVDGLCRTNLTLVVSLTCRL